LNIQQAHLIFLQHEFISSRVLPFASFMLETIFNLNYSVRDVEGFKMELNKNKFQIEGHCQRHAER
jgi:hypothetical protein